jgi:hypothetical protein
MALAERVALSVGIPIPRETTVDKDRHVTAEQLLSWVDRQIVDNSPEDAGKT